MNSNNMNQFENMTIKQLKEMTEQYKKMKKVINKVVSKNPNLMEEILEDLK